MFGLDVNRSIVCEKIKEDEARIYIIFRGKEFFIPRMLINSVKTLDSTQKAIEVNTKEWFLKKQRMLSLTE